MVFNDMLFGKSTNVNNNTAQIEQNTNAKWIENKSENCKLNSSFITYSSSSIKNIESNNSFNKIISSTSTKANIIRNEPIRSSSSQSSVGRGYFAFGIPKSPSFHSGLDQLANDYDETLIHTTAKEIAQSENLSCGGDDSNTGVIGCKFKFTNVEEIKVKLTNSSLSTISTAKKAYNNKMPALQPYAQKVNISTNHLQSSYSSLILETPSSSALSQRQQEKLSSIVNTSNSATLSARASMIMATSSSSSGGDSIAATNTISSTTSSIVSTLAQHLNAATSATQLLTTASSTLGSNYKSPVSAATAIKNILNATKYVGSGASSNVSCTNNINGIGQGQCNAASSAITTATSTSASLPSQSSPATTNYCSVTQTIVSGISISLGIGYASNNFRLTRNSSSNASQVKSQNNAIGSKSSNVQYHNGNENCQSINNSDDTDLNGSEPFVSLTLQQISGSPGRARDRNVFHTPTSAATTVQLRLLRGF